MSTLVPAFELQDELFSSAFSVLGEAISQRAFPSASVAITHAAKLVALKSFGHFVYETDLVAPPLSRSWRRGGGVDVTPATLFDLASLTKVVATTPVAMILYEHGLLDLEAPVVGIIPEFHNSSDLRRDNVTFRMLLAHSSGLPTYEKLYLKAHTRDELLRAAFTLPLAADPGTRAEYSDIGFIILGAALERIVEESLATFCQREIFGPLAMTRTTFNPPAEIWSQVPPTADGRTGCGAGTPARETAVPQMASDASLENSCSTFRNRIIQGEVQDENAFVLGGIAAHAGLFSTAEDVARFANAMLQCGAGAPAREKPGVLASSSASRPAARPLLRPETISLFTRRESAPLGTSRALGWDTPSTPSQSGKYFGLSSFGHLGYTGTSLWIDPERQLSITLLTNRTWPDCANQAIRQIRPRFHDAVVGALFDLR